MKWIIAEVLVLLVGLAIVTFAVGALNARMNSKSLDLSILILAYVLIASTSLLSIYFPAFWKKIKPRKHD